MAKKRTRLSTAATAEPDLSYIAEALRPLAVPIDTLNPDPANARTHSEKNLRTIQSSIAQFGQRTPIVVNTNGNIIEKGNGTWEAMKAAGHTHIAVVPCDDDPTTQVGYAIADNRAGELAAWDIDVLESQLAALGDSDFSIESIGFDEGELDSIIQSALPPEEPPETPAAESTTQPADDKPETTPAAPNQEAQLGDKFQIIIECDDEEQQRDLLDKFQTEGYSCRALLA